MQAYYYYYYKTWQFKPLNKAIKHTPVAVFVNNSFVVVSLLQWHLTVANVYCASLYTSVPINNQSLIDTPETDNKLRGDTNEPQQYLALPLSKILHNYIFL